MTSCPHCPAHLEPVTTHHGPALHCPSCGHIEPAIDRKTAQEVAPHPWYNQPGGYNKTV